MYIGHIYNVIKKREIIEILDGVPLHFQVAAPAINKTSYNASYSLSE